MSLRRKRASAGLGAARLVGRVPGTITRVGRAIHASSQSTAALDSPTYTAQTGDLLLVIATVSGTGRTLTPTSTGLSFTSIYAGSASFTTCTMGAWYAIAPDDTGRAITVTSSAASQAVTVTVVVLRGCAASPVDAAAAVGGVGSSTTPAVPSLTTVTDRALAFAVVQSNDDNYFYCSEVGWVTVKSITPTTARGMAIACREVPTAGATGTVTFEETTNGPDAIDYLTFALAAAA